MIIRPTYVLKTIPHVSESIPSDVTRYICEFLVHPFLEIRRINTCNIAGKLYHDMAKRIREIEGMMKRGVKPNNRTNAYGPFAINSLYYLKHQIEQFLRCKDHIPLEKLLILCRTYKCEWYCRSVEKVPMLKNSLRYPQIFLR